MSDGDLIGPDRTERESSRREAVVWLWVLAATAAVSWLLLRTTLRLPAAPPSGSGLMPAHVVAALWGLALSLLVIVALRGPALAAPRRAKGVGATSVALLLRLTAAAGLLALLVTTGVLAWRPAAQHAAVEAAFCAALALGLAVPLAAFAVDPRRLAPPRRRWVRALDAAVFNAIALVLVAELSVATAARVSSSPLLSFDRVFGGSGGEQAVRETLRHFRLKPGTPFYDATVNSRGYVDDEFFQAGRNDFVVAVLADSFGVGVVPMRYNFTSVAERALQAALAGRFDRVAVHNFGVASISPPEYYYLLVNEALDYKPSLVVLCLFIGNDLGAPLARPQVSMLTLQSWRSVQLVERLAALKQTTGGGAVEFTDWGRFQAGVPPWVLDDRLERPTFGEQRFLALERERVGECNVAWPALPARYARMCTTLSEFHHVLGDRLLLALVPDEYQVNDDLWRALLSRVENPSALHREHPQQQLLECCRRQGIQALDLLPALRHAEREARTYHLRDTHWNAHGNRVAGEAIAAWILASRLDHARPS